MSAPGSWAPSPEGRWPDGAARLTLSTLRPVDCILAPRLHGSAQIEVLPDEGGEDGDGVTNRGDIGTAGGQVVVAGAAERVGVRGYLKICHVNEE